MPSNSSKMYFSHAVLTARVAPVLMMLVVCTFCACREKTKSESRSLRTVVQKTTTTEKEQADRQRWRKEEISDSIRLKHMLDSALDIARRHIDKTAYQNSYTVAPDLAFTGSVHIVVRKAFNSSDKHILIRRRKPCSVFNDVYLWKNRRLTRVISDEQSGCTYTSDTVMDVNGDRRKDFVVNWYGSSGCCLKGWSAVYLMRSGGESFSPVFTFINPTFSPEEGVIRGVEYGHPGETEMYKFRWKGEQVDTVEYVQYERDNHNRKTGKFVVSSRPVLTEGARIFRRTKRLSREYDRVNGLDWFIGFR